MTNAQEIRSALIALGVDLRGSGRRTGDALTLAEVAAWLGVTRQMLTRYLARAAADDDGVDRPHGRMPGDPVVRLARLLVWCARRGELEVGVEATARRISGPGLSASNGTGNSEPVPP